MDKNSQTLRVLIVEDNPSDAELMLCELRGAGFKPDWQRVDTETEFSRSLDPNIDIILSDYALPQFNGLRALELLKERGLGVPFIIVSGTISEETAVEAIRSGAADYLLKDRLARLGEAVKHALEQKRVRDESKHSEEALGSLRREYKLILNSAGEGIHGLDLDGNIIFENPKAGELLGWKTDKLLGRPAHATMHHTRSDGSKYPIEECPIYASMRDGAARRVTNDVFWRKDGSSFRVDFVSAPIKDEHGHVRGCIVTFKDITEQWVAEARQKLQADQYRLLFETNPNPMWVFETKSLQILAVNQAAIKQYGYSREEFLNLTLTDLRSAEDAPDLMKSITSSTSPAEFSGQFTHIRKDRSVILVDVYSGPIMWEGVAARIVSAIDITDRKRATERMEAVLESALDCIITMDHQGRVVEFNPAAEETFGYSLEEAIGRPLAQLIIPPSLRERHERGLSHYLATGEAPVFGKRIELTAMRKDGSEFPVELAITRIGSQEPPMFTGFIRDITERTRADERVREQTNIINQARDAIIIRNFADQRVTFWNAGAERLYGWNAEEAIGRPIGELIATDPRDVDTYTKIIGSTGQFHGEMTQRTKDGKELIVEGRATLIADPDGTPRSALLINTDITEHKKLETQLLRSQRLESIGTLASGVAHDLNNILTPILMCAQTLREDLNAADRQSAISLIEDSAQRGAGVVKQVLTFARGVEGERVLINPTHLIEEMIDIARKTFPKSIELFARYSENLWTIQGDPTQLHQVLLNLSVNARDAMPSGGSLTLAVENFTVDENYAAMTPDAKVGPYVMLRASDNGAGMRRATVDKIFDPFFTTKDVGKGTGLGLSTVLGIVKSHGGFISVYSDPGKGTTFKIFLPATMSDQDLQKSKTAVVPIRGNGELILVVDDEPNILGITKMILERHGYGVLSASDGPEALAIFAQQMKSISLVLTDLSMPYMDGVALVRSLKKMRPDLSIIASTGQGEQAGMAELESVGVKNFLTKPYNTERLLATLDDTLRDRRSESPGVQTT